MMKTVRSEVLLMLRRLAVVLALAAPSLASPGLLPAQTALAAGRVAEVEVPAPARAGNLLDTPSIQGAAVYLPPSYDSEPNRRFPVVYLLLGIFDDYGVWLEHFAVPARLDWLIAAGEIPELLLVMPNASNRYGALHLAMTRAGLCSSVWALSPCCLAAVDDFSFGNDAWQRAARADTAEDLQSLLASDDVYAVATLGAVIAFSPDPGKPPVYGDFLFDLVRGEVVLDDEAFDRYRKRPWRSHSNSVPSASRIRSTSMPVITGKRPASDWST